jgi:hypothetical protein
MKNDFAAGNTASLTVGGGGSGSSGNNAGTQGGLSQIICGSFTITANGGSGGQGASGGDGNGGAGGNTSGNGTDQIPGENGENGGVQNNIWTNDSGDGGRSYPDIITTLRPYLGGGRAGGVQTSDGRNGNFPGGGASGAHVSAAGMVNRTGGNGAAGRVIITYYTSLNVTGADTYTAGSTLQLSVFNPDAVTYTWKRNGTTIGTGATLSIPNITSSHAGSYTVECSYAYPNVSSFTISGTGIGFAGNTIVITSPALNVTVTP